MRLSRFLSVLGLGGCLMLVSAVVLAAADEDKKPRKFGPYEAILFDEEYLQNVRVTGADVFIMLQPAHRNDQLTMKISMQKGAPYRKWFTGEEVLVAQENSGRAANTWTDRIQTSATYIEYYSGGKLFLHLKKVGE